jgi:hypothetical protein
MQLDTMQHTCSMECFASTVHESIAVIERQHMLFGTPAWAELMAALTLYRFAMRVPRRHALS